MFKFLSSKDRVMELSKKSEALTSHQDDTDLTSNITFVTLAESGTIDEVTATEHIDIFSSWVEGIMYDVGSIRSYKGGLYRCTQVHTSDEDNSPETSAGKWIKIGDPKEEYPQWSQPVGSLDAYEKGAKVSLDNDHWISEIDNNIWMPGVYGWVKVEV